MGLTKEINTQFLFNLMEEGSIHEEKTQCQGYEIENERQIIVIEYLEEYVRSQFSRGFPILPIMPLLPWNPPHKGRCGKKTWGIRSKKNKALGLQHTLVVTLHGLITL